MEKNENIEKTEKIKETEKTKKVLNGIINIYKPKGITSHDVVYKLRKILGIKKIGHTGTLDPDAKGVLPMCIGRATKTADLLTAADKQYIAEVTLGSRTDTLDATGEILESSAVNVTKEDIAMVVKGFVGEIEQIPPMYSAIKINGKKLYELAREGKEVERKSRTVLIGSVEILDYNLSDKKFTMRVDCSKGTYIRTLCDDIGEKLGCFAHMSALERTKSGRFDLEHSVTLDEVERKFSNGDVSFLTPIDEVFAEYPKIIITAPKVKKMCNGVNVVVAGLEEGMTYRIYDEAKNFLTISKQLNGKLKTLNTFYQIL
ncbi:MAG: tRNA pseudouridine(55) synthase TruB [Oscillospiraceae bacterium]